MDAFDVDEEMGETQRVFGSGPRPPRSRARLLEQALGEEKSRNNTTGLSQDRGNTAPST